ncbi:MAG: hypothetical protein A2W11_00440 [Ignavibacteria bacterium RBG_16_35_7]|nr:MAG: hypothetical protein A2W11_00440 [Ignavibacteria bacterium RBG_16_35_7]
MAKFTNAFAEILALIEPNKNEIEFDVLTVKVGKKSERYEIDNKRLFYIVSEIISSSKYKDYRHRERLTAEITQNLSSYFNIRLKGRTASFPIKTRVGDVHAKDELTKNYFEELRCCGITENGVDSNAAERETELTGEISRIQKDTLLPIPFVRYDDFQIIEIKNNSDTPEKVALLNLFSAESGKFYLNKFGLSKKTFIGKDIYSNSDFEFSSVTKLACVLEWSLYHQLNYFNIGTPKTAKLVFDNRDKEFYLHVTFQFLPHTDKEGKLHYLKRSFDRQKTRISETGLDENKRKKIYSCYDALTGEVIDIPSTNKTTENKTRETESFLGVDLGRVCLAAFAVVKDGKILYKDFAETGQFSQKLYRLYDEISILQSAGKQNRKRLRELHKKILQITNHNIHRTANRIIWARDYYNAELVLENLKGLKSLPKKKIQQYGKLSVLLTYKSQLKGFRLIKFNPPEAYYEIYPSQTSKLCSRCGFTHQENRQMKISQKDFKCIACNFEDNADMNAAVNIARLGEYYLKYKELYPTFDEYLIKIAGCYKANFDEYKERQKKRRELFTLTKMIDRQIKKQKLVHKEKLVDVL